MIPFLAYPLALIALASLPALAAIYLLRNRFRRRQVSSLLLWRFRVLSQEGGTRVNRLLLPLLFFLELLALLLLVTAAAGPHWKLPQAVRPLVVVLDDSFSMRAAADGTTAQERARAFLQKLFARQPPPTTRLLLAGSEARLLGPAAKSWAEVDMLLQQWRCQAPVSALEPAVTLAAELGRQQANLLLLTDHPPPDEKPAGDRLQWRSFGAPAGNLAIVNASRTANGQQDRCLLDVANLSRAPRSSRLLVRTGAATVQQTRLSLSPMERQRFVFNLASSEATLEAALDDDALAVDNQVQLLPPLRRRVRVQVSLTNAALGELVERTLTATGLRAALSANPELVIHQTDASPSSDAWSLCWRTPEKATAFTGPFIIDGAHPLAQGLELAGTVWTAGALTNPPGSLPLILAGNVPLLYARDDLAGRQFLTLNLDAGLSTLSTTPDWPILFWNLLSWRASQLPGLQENNARLGSDVLLKTTGEPVTLRLPDGSVKSFPKTAGVLALETPLPGLYEATMGASTNTFAVNPLAGDESDLSACATGHWGDWARDASTLTAQSPMAWLFALLALGALTAHLCLVVVGKGGRA